MEDWVRIRTLFEAALEIPEPERAAYLKVQCGDDLSLYSTVLDLLNNCAPVSPLDSDGKESLVFRDGELIGGRFRIVRFIDRGGMGEVYEAYDESLFRKRLALKTLRPELCNARDAIERFRRELLVARDVTHENVCRVFDFVDHQVSSTEPAGAKISCPCFTMELIEGESMAQLIARERPLPLDDALGLIRQMASALDALHQRAIVHRDLKPSNIMLTRRKEGKLRAIVMDFGLAKPEGQTDMFNSVGDFRAGAAFFMAPEILRGMTHTMASDIYAFGLIIDELVTSNSAFPAGSMAGLCFAKFCEPFPPPTLRSKDLPDFWEKTILRCVQFDPEKRFSTAREIVEALEPGPMTLDSAQSVSKRRPALLSRRWFVRAGIATPIVVPAVYLAGTALFPMPTSIGVYEIANETRDSAYDYLCKGTTSELMRRLTQLSGVAVIPMHATRAEARQPNQSRLSLEGSLQVYNGRVRLSMLVSNTKTGALVWSETFDRRLIEDPLELQSEIAAGTVATLDRQVLPGRIDGLGPVASVIAAARRTLGTTANSNVGRPPTRSNAALNRYMQGRHLLERPNPQTIRAAIREFEDAVTDDPGFALAYAALTDAHLFLTKYSYLETPELMSRARSSAEKAVDADPALAEAHEALGQVHERLWEWHEAEKSYTKAIDLKPALASARRWYAGLLTRSGQASEGVRHVRRAYELDPHDPTAAMGLGLSLFLAGEYDEAIDMLTPAAQGRDALGACHNLGDVHAHLGCLAFGQARDTHFQKAFQLAHRVTEIETLLSPGKQAARTPWGDKMNAHYHALRGDKKAARPHLQRLIADLETGNVSPTSVAMVYTAEGRNSEALDLLQRAVSIRDQFVPFIKVMPFFQGLRQESRFTQLLIAIRI